MHTVNVNMMGLGSSALLLNAGLISNGDAFAQNASPIYFGRSEMSALPRLSLGHDLRRPLCGGAGGVSRLKMAVPHSEAQDDAVHAGQTIASLCDPAVAPSCAVAGGCDLASVINGLSVCGFSQDTTQRLRYALCESALADESSQLFLPNNALKRLADADLALAAGRMREAVIAFDDLRHCLPVSVCEALEVSLCQMLHRTSVAFLRNPEAILPDGASVPPDSHRGGYHGTARVPPALALSQGLAVRGPNTRLLEHVMGAGDSAFRGATPTVSDPEGLFGAALWANEGGWVYDIRQVPTWNADLHLQGRRAQQVGYSDNLLSGEVELVIPGYIPPDKIKRYGQVVLVHGIPRVKTWHDNPNYGKPANDKADTTQNIL